MGAELTNRTAGAQSMRDAAIQRSALRSTCGEVSMTAAMTKVVRVVVRTTRSALVAAQHDDLDAEDVAGHAVLDLGDFIDEGAVLDAGELEHGCGP